VRSPILETDRLVLKALDTSFTTDTYVTWMNDPEIIKFLESGGDYTLEKLSNYLKTVEQQEILFWAIITKESEKHIGNIKIDPINKKHSLGEYGILMGDKSEWGKGYAREASQAVIDYCFSESVNLHKITLGLVEDNLSALKLYNRLGFIQEGKYIKHANYRGQWYNVIRMAVFNPNWRG
jgi:ribosomal-protein-alanine N-acetyltransferase